MAVLEFGVFSLGVFLAVKVWVGKRYAVIMYVNKNTSKKQVELFIYGTHIILFWQALPYSNNDLGYPS